MQIDKLHVIRQTTNGVNPMVSYLTPNKERFSQNIKEATIFDSKIFLDEWIEWCQGCDKADGIVGMKYEAVPLFDAIINFYRPR